MGGGRDKRKKAQEKKEGPSVPKGDAKTLQKTAKNEVRLRGLRGALQAARVLTGCGTCTGARTGLATARIRTCVCARAGEAPAPDRQEAGGQ